MSHPKHIWGDAHLGDCLAWTLAAGIYSAMGAFMVLLGFGVLFANPRGPTNRLFALFAILDGGTTLVVMGSRMVPDVELALTFSRVFWIYNAPLKSILLYFALAFPTPSPSLQRFPRLVPTLVLAPGLAGSLIFLFNPGMYLGPVAERNYFFGPLAPFDILLGSVFAGLALVILARKFVALDRPLARREISLVLAAILLLHVPVALMNAVLRTNLPAGFADILTFEARPSRLAFFYGALALLAAASWALASTRRSTADRRELRVIGTAFTFTVAVGIALLFIRDIDYQTLLLAMSSFGGVTLLGYGVLKYQLFGLDVGFRRMAPAAVAVVGIGALFTALMYLISPFDDGASILGMQVSVVAAGLLTMVVSPAVVTATRHATQRFMGDPSNLGYYANLKRLEVYRAAVEKTRADPSAFPSQWLLELRDRLGLDARDHEIAEALVETGTPTARADPLRPGALVLGKYRVMNLLGEGGFGAAYLAHHVPLDRQIVLKEVRAPLAGDQAALKSLVREARLGAMLQHPNVVTVFDLEERPAGVLFVMEYCEGGSLEDRLDRTGPMAAPAVVRLLDEVLMGVEALSLAGVVHRDLKPSNVLFDRTGRAKLGDLGVAYRPGVSEDLLTGTGLGVPAGTLAYLAPEVVRGSRATTRSDIYAAAALAYRALAGNSYVPLKGTSAFDLQRFIVEREPDLGRLPVSSAFRGVLRRAFAKDPAERFENAGAMRAALRLVPEARVAWQQEALYSVKGHPDDGPGGHWEESS